MFFIEFAAIGGAFLFGGLMALMNDDKKNFYRFRFLALLFFIMSFISIISIFI